MKAILFLIFMDLGWGGSVVNAETMLDQIKKLPDYTSKLYEIEVEPGLSDIQKMELIHDKFQPKTPYVFKVLYRTPGMGSVFIVKAYTGSVLKKGDDYLELSLEAWNKIVSGERILTPQEIAQFSKITK